MNTRRSKLAQFTFAEMAGSLATAHVGDVVRVSVNRRSEPSAYTVLSREAATLYVQGQQGAERTLTFGASEGEVWLCKGGRGRRVVQAWVEGKSVESMLAGKQEEHPEAAGVALLAFHKYRCEMIRRLHAALGIEHTGDPEPANIEAVIDDLLARIDTEVSGLHDVIYDLTNTVQMCRADIAAQASRIADHGHQLERVSNDRDASRLALAQIRNVASGREPGASMLPSNTEPSTVVIEVTAALYREATGQRQRDQVNGYRKSIAVHLPDRMHGEAVGQ